MTNNNYGHFQLKESKKDGYKYPKSILTFSKVAPNNIVHPTQKPVELLEYLIKTYSKEKDVVFDPFMGSGSTGVASLNTDREFIGIELNVDYFNIAKERLSNVSREEY